MDVQSGHLTEDVTCQEMIEHLQTRLNVLGVFFGRKAHQNKHTKAAREYETWRAKPSRMDQVTLGATVKEYGQQAYDAYKSSGHMHTVLTDIESLLASLGGGTSFNREEPIKYSDYKDVIDTIRRTINEKKSSLEKSFREANRKHLDIVPPRGVKRFKSKAEEGPVKYLLNWLCSARYTLLAVEYYHYGNWKSDDPHAINPMLAFVNFEILRDHAEREMSHYAYDDHVKQPRF